ncbi:sensor histidine kinase [Frisingicoccus sp.]|uniref:sensor histidine kinase n=1 Tax=Frisingicoccus sp. TaxID=1918627 RepID=UPI002E76BF5A|nr:HAMP domain-containing sensor histidine kinase [Frisingicoccus sp.]MEE0753217.1 HAMP domain-containing sensor histidine kinase [Frisingicoccus sp.]
MKNNLHLKSEKQMTPGARTALWVLGGIFIFALAIYSVDTLFNGLVLEWLQKRYTSSFTHWDTTGEMAYYYELLDWHGMKLLALLFLAVFTLIWLFVLFFVTRYYSRKKVGSAVSDIASDIRDYMAEDVEVQEIFGGNYGEISTQMVEIKAAMQRHEQILKEEASRKNDLITYLAHDLKTPLTSVIGYLSLMDEAPDMPEAQKARYVHITLDKACRLEKLINEFFEITRYNLQQIILEKETIDLYYMLVQMTDEFYPVLSARGNTIRLSVGEDMTVYGDSEKLARVFNNILKNAVSYSYENTEIEIGAEKVEDGLKITFRNRGKTIAREKLEFLFEKFFRMDEARATHTGGAGLGLAIAKEIVTLHGGTITAESENEVTTFCVILPEGL